jgi:hypothetical protein
MKGQQAGADVKSRNRALVRILALPWMFGLFQEESMMSRGRDFHNGQCRNAIVHDTV